MPRGVPNAKAVEKLTVGEVPSVATTGQTHDTTEDNAQLQLPNSGAPASDPGQALHNPALADLQRLHNFLMLNYPKEFARTNRQRPETAVEVAMRLLSGVHNSKVATCSAPYCNLPEDHQSPEHGWVQATRL